MSTDLDYGNIFGMISVIWSVIQGSALFHVLKWFLMIYTVVLFVDLVLVIALRGISGNLNVQLHGATRPSVSKNKAAARFRSIEARLRSDNPSQYKVAVLEADQFADEVLKGSGYAGENMGERLSTMQPGHIACYEDLKSAHEVRNQIVNDPAFVIDHAQAEELLEKYKKLFVELELLS